MATTPNVSSYELPQLTDLINRSFDEQLESMPRDFRKSGLVVENTKAMHTGVFTRYDEAVVIDEYASSRPEGDQAVQARVQFGYEKDLECKPFALALGITKVMRDAGKNQQIEKIIDSLSTVVPNRMELDLSHRFTFFSSTSYVNADGETVNITLGNGLALGSASHTLTGSSTTYSNLITGNPQFSEGSLEIAEKSFIENSYNNLGQKMVIKPDTIFSTDDPNTRNQVLKLLHATADVSSSNSGTYNPYSSKYKYVVLSRIATDAKGATDSTKSKYWGLASAKNSDMHLDILNSPYLTTPKSGNNGEDITTETRTFVAGANYGICIVSGKWIRLSKGDGS